MYAELQGQEARNVESILPTALLIVDVEKVVAKPPKQLAAGVEKIDKNARMIAAWELAGKIATRQKREVIDTFQKGEMIEDRQRLQLWTELNEPRYSYREVRRLFQPGKRDELVKLFLQLREHPEHKKRVEAMQRELLEERPEALPEVLDVWLQLELSPEGAFFMMPVSAISSKHNSG
uniref:RxLR effector candidate protein n=2 Tax=Hyaloperonospora arabidopsidis (strain Emoy2) TaxID=559515 RepID=M4C4Z7_HYAAE